MPVSMAVRLHLTAVLLFAITACGGGGGEAEREVRLLAPAGIVEDATGFERGTGCRVDLRIYDDGEDVDAIARRRDADAVAGPVPPGRTPDVSVELVRITLEGGLELTIPKALASAFDRPVRPAGRRSIVWTIREAGDNEACARRWLDYATSQ
jgi:hypothetical protein